MAVETPQLPSGLTEQPETDELLTTQPPPGWYANPSGPGRRYWDGVKWTDSYSEAAPVVEKQGWGPVKLTFGYFFAALGGLIGFFFGLAAATNSDPRTKKHGYAMMVLSVIAFIAWAAIVSS